MVKLTQEEKEWLRENFSQLLYNEEKNTLSGNVSFNHYYLNCPVIKDEYQVYIDMENMANRFELPIVYNPDNRIKKMAVRKQKPTADFHLNVDESLCLIFPLKREEYYPNGFNIQYFMKHLCEHLYWVSYYERYDKEAWLGEKHGIEGLFDYILDKNNYEKIVKNKDLLSSIQLEHKKRYGSGIAISKLKNRLKEHSFIKKLLYE